MDADGLLSLKTGGDTDDYIYFNTASNNPGMYFENSTYDSGIVFNGTDNALEFYAADASSTELAISLTTAQITHHLPTSFESSGDVAMANDLRFTNGGSSSVIFENGPG